MLYTTFWPLPAFRAQSNRGEFQTKANFRSLHQILHISSLFITIESSPCCSGHRRHIQTKPNFHPVQQNPTQFITFHHFWMTSSLKPNPISAPRRPTTRGACPPSLI